MTKPASPALAATPGIPLTCEEGLRRITALRAARTQEGPVENRAAAELHDFISTANYCGYLVELTGEYERDKYVIGCCGSLVRPDLASKRWTGITFAAHPDGPLFPHVVVDLSRAQGLALLGPY